MASTYSTNLGIELITTGEQAGTWGTTTNTNLGTLIEQAISGYVTQVITDGSDTVITMPDGTTGVARNMFIEMTSAGALTATRNLIVPADRKLYFIYNNTTGGFAVTVKVTGLTGVSVPNGRKVILVCNGTDIVEAHNAISGNATVGGTLVVTGATTSASLSLGTALPVASGGTGVTTSTGTGNTVLSISPALTTPNLGTPSAGTLTNCTFPTLNQNTTGNAATATTSAALTNGGTLNTPGSGTLTNCTGYPAANISGLGTGVATFLATPSSANLAAAVTGETGTGALVFGTSPTLATPVISSIVNTGTLTLPTSTDTLVGRATTDTLTNKTLTSPTLTAPALGTPASGTLTNCNGTAASLTAGSANALNNSSPLNTPSSGNLSNCTNLPIDAGTTGTLPTNRGGTGVTAGSTGTGGVVLSNSPSLTSPALGTPSSGNLSNCTNLPIVSLTAGVTGTLPVANGGTGATNSVGTGNYVMLNSSPTVDGTGIGYPDSALAMGVSDNQIGFGWDSPDAYVSVDNSTFGAFVSLSDYRIKKDVRTLSSNATYITNAIRVVDYEVLELDGTQKPEKAGIRRVGVIAHEIQELIPSAATGKKDSVSAAGSPLYQSINYDAVVPFLIKTIQELTARIEKLEG